MKKLNLGCGSDIKKGFVNIDLYSDEADIKWDLDKYPYPFKDNTFDFIFASHIIEHLDDPTRCLQELRRILKVNGDLRMIIPYSAHASAFNPTHRNYWHLGMFREPLYTKDSEFAAMFDGYKLITRKLWFFGHNAKKKSWNKIFWLFNKYWRMYEYTGLRYIFPGREIVVVLKKIK